MLIYEAAQAAGLTKKAVVYYTEQGLVSPVRLKNGYRDYREADVARLQKIAVLRRLELGTGEIRAVLEDPSGTMLRKLSVKRLLAGERRQAKEALLTELGHGASYESVAERLTALEENGTIAEALLTAFPGDFGRFVCLHFARFLTGPIETEEQRTAFETVLHYLDGLPPLTLPDAVQACLDDSVGRLEAGSIRELLAEVRMSLADPQAFMEEHREMLEWYLAYQQTEAYHASAAGQLKRLLRQFQESSGYCEVFLPAMQRLSPAYAAYCRQLETANAALLAQYPQAANGQAEVVRQENCTN